VLAAALSDRARRLFRPCFLTRVPGGSARQPPDSASDGYPRDGIEAFGVGTGKTLMRALLGGTLRSFTWCPGPSNHRSF
jgi:hypothetical protein